MYKRQVGPCGPSAWGTHQGQESGPVGSYTPPLPHSLVSLGALDLHSSPRARAAAAPPPRCAAPSSSQADPSQHFRVSVSLRQACLACPERVSQGRPRRACSAAAAAAFTTTRELEATRTGPFRALPAGPPGPALLSESTADPPPCHLAHLQVAVPPHSKERVALSPCYLLHT